MEIQTQEFKLPKKAYFRVLIASKLKYIIIGILLVASVILFVNRKKLSPEIIKNMFLIIGVALLSYLFIIYFLRIHTNKIFNVDYIYTISEAKLIIQYDEKVVSEYELENFSFVKKSKGNYFLYLSKKQILILPENSFKDSDDKSSFEEILKQKKLI